MCVKDWRGAVRLASIIAVVSWTLGARATAAAQAALAPIPAAPASVAPTSVAPAQSAVAGPDIKVEPTATTGGLEFAGSRIEQSFIVTAATEGGVLSLPKLAGPKGAAETTWSMAGRPVNQVRLAAGEGVTLLMTAEAPQPGPYVARLALRNAAGQTLALHDVRIARRSIEPPAGALAAQPAPQEVPAEGRPCVRLEVTASNPGSFILLLNAPRLASLTQEVDGRMRSLPVTGQCDGQTLSGYQCSTHAATDSVTLPPGQSCTGFVTAKLAGPGDYTARVTASAPDGGAVSVDVRAAARRSWIWLVALAVLGSALGWGFGAFRRYGRDAALVAEDAATLRGRLLELERDAPSPVLGRIPARFAAALAELVREAQDSKDIPALRARLATLRLRVRRLERWDTLERAVAGAPASAALLDALKTLRAGLEDPGSPDTEVDLQFRAVEAALQAAAAEPGAQAAPRDVLRAAAPSFTPPTLDYHLSFFDPGDTATTIRRKRRWLDGGANLLVLILIALTAVQLLWVTNPTWGGLGDLLAAFLGAFAAQVGGGALLGQLTGTPAAPAQPAVPVQPSPR